MAAHSGIQYINLTDPLLNTGLAGVEAMVTHNSNTSAYSFRILGLIVPGPQYDIDGTTIHIAIGDDQAISFKPGTGMDCHIQELVSGKNQP